MVVCSDTAVRCNRSDRSQDGVGFCRRKPRHYFKHADGGVLAVSVLFRRVEVGLVEKEYMILTAAELEQLEAELERPAKPLPDLAEMILKVDRGEL